MTEQTLLLQMADALQRAESFIKNGVALGFIRMPDAQVPDPAHQTLPAIQGALAAFNSHQQAKSSAEPALLAALAQAKEEFEDCEETVVSYETLMKLCAKGWLECSRFELTKAGRDVLAQQPVPLLQNDNAAA